MLTYRTLFRWGDPEHQEKLDGHTRQALRELFQISEDQFKNPWNPGNQPVSIDQPSQITASQAEALASIVGSENVGLSDEERARAASGKFFSEILSLRIGQLPLLPEAVVAPRSEEEIVELLDWCRREGFVLTPQGGRSSVTRGVEIPKNGLALDLTRHLSQVIELDEVSHLVRVQPGMYGPDFEAWLNKRGYTCGHFPQSFEYSTVGGWVAAKGAGQLSTGYGKIEHMVLALRVVTPAGIFENIPFPASAQGWDLFPAFIGSEGSLGVITEVTMKIRPLPESRPVRHTFLFRDFEPAIMAMRQIMQAGGGIPHLFRLSDPEETEMAFRLKGFNGSLADQILKALGYQPSRRCLMFVSIEGEAGYNRAVSRVIRRKARENGALNLGAKPTRQWLEQRFHSAYLREPMMDLGLMTDTIETAVTWKDLHRLWENTRAYIKSRPQTICMVHLSHLYENGANLYFTFLSPINRKKPLEDYQQFHQGLVESILSHGGSLSHHHGVGRSLKPWMDQMHSLPAQEMMRALKNTLDPKNIMNPGSVI